MTIKTLHHNEKKKKENKIPKDEITEKPALEPILIGEYYSVHTRKYHPLTLRFVETQCIKLKEWADQETSLHLYDYTDAQGYNPDTFYDWCKKFPDLHHAHQYALRRIGSRHFQGAMTRKFAEGTIHRTLGHYHDIWKKETHELARLKDEVAQNEKTTIIIERFPEMPSTRTPEEVAGAIRKATGDARDYGPQGPWKKLQNKEEE